MSTPRLILLGPRGSGKTILGRLLADAWGVPLVDLDAAVVKTAGRSIAEVFADAGEAAFRDLEAAALAGALTRNAVVATGGGVVVRASNRALLLACACPRVFLHADARILWQRIAADPATAATRPALTAHAGEAEVRHLLDQRRPLYEAVATQSLDVGRLTPAEAAAELQPRRTRRRTKPG